MQIGDFIEFKEPRKAKILELINECQSYRDGMAYMARLVNTTTDKLFLSVRGELPELSGFQITINNDGVTIVGIEKPKPQMINP